MTGWQCSYKKLLANKYKPQCQEWAAFFEIFGQWGPIDSQTLQGIANDLDRHNKTLLLNTPYALVSITWRNSAGTHLEPSSLLANFHSAGRGYVCCQRRKVIFTLSQLWIESWELPNNWSGKTCLLCIIGAQTPWE